MSRRCCCCSWFLLDKTMYAVNVGISIPCMLLAWAVVVVFSQRLRSVVTSGKHFTHERKTVSRIVFAMTIIQVMPRAARSANADGFPLGCQRVAMPGALGLCTALHPSSWAP